MGGAHPTNNSFGLVTDSASNWFPVEAIEFYTRHLSAEAMLVAIAVLPAPEVPTTTTRICLSLVPAKRGYPIARQRLNVCCWPTRTEGSAQAVGASLVQRT